MKRRTRVLGLYSIGLTVLLSAGCATSQHSFKNQNMDFSTVQTVAVLPFENLTSDKDAAERVRDSFMGMLLATGAVYVLPPGEVARGISRVGMHTPETPTTDEVKSLGHVLSVQAVITGVLREYGSVRSGSSEANVVSLSLQMLEVQTGSTVWSASSTKGGITLSDRLFGGGGHPMNKVTEEVINDLLDQLFK